MSDKLIYKLYCEQCRMNLKDFIQEDMFLYCKCESDDIYPKCSGVFISINIYTSIISLCYKNEMILHYGGNIIIQNIENSNNNKKYCYEFNLDDVKNDNSLRYIDFIYSLGEKYRKNLVFL